jgi:hypothetical protein
MIVRDSPEARSYRQVIVLRNSPAQSYCFVSVVRAGERTDLVSSDPEANNDVNLILKRYWAVLRRGLFLQRYGIGLILRRPLIQQGD